MANLLPKEMMQSVRSSFRSRLILVTALMFLGLALFTALMLLPSYIVLKVQEAPLGVGNTTPAGGVSAAQLKTEQADLARANTLLTKVKPFTTVATSSTQLIESALSLRPKGIRINNVSINLNGKKTLFIVAEAATRDQVNQYREILSKDPRFQNVSVPVGALLGADGGKFTISLVFAGS